jgi:hypothetical protein
MVIGSDAERRLLEIESLAKGWGILLAEQAFPGGVGLDVDLWQMEEVAVRAAKALVAGAIETMTSAQAEALTSEADCPDCGRSCEVGHRPRPVQVRGGSARLREPVAHCSTCRRDFFPSAAGVEARRARL